MGIRPAQGRFLTVEGLDANARVELAKERRQYLSISQRSLDYLLANGNLNVRRIGSRALIPIAELRRYTRLC
jgi:hypothetical protein